jgi:hypothetical protein
MVALVTALCIAVTVSNVRDVIRDGASPIAAFVFGAFSIVMLASSAKLLGAALKPAK